MPAGKPGKQIPAFALPRGYMRENTEKPLAGQGCDAGRIGFFRHAGFRAGLVEYVPRDLDPRAPRLMSLVRAASSDNTVTGRFAEIGEAVQANLGQERPLAMNIDGATAVIFCELDFPAPLSRGLFCLSRSVGILAHAWEQMQQGGRNKGPMPPAYLPLYEPDGADSK